MFLQKIKIMFKQHALLINFLTKMKKFINKFMTKRKHNRKHKSKHTLFDI